MRRIFRILIVVLGGFLLLCIVATGISALVNRTLPSHSEMVERLSDLDKARLAEILHLRRELGDAVWPGWSQADIPIILYNEEYAFLMGYPDPPPGWADVPSGEHHGSFWEKVPNDTLYGETYYRQQLPSPDETPQAFTVRVGDRWAASMVTKDWMEIGLVTKVREELPTLFAPIFPYKLVVEVFNTDWHTAAVQHEAFHAYQGITSGRRLEEAEAKIALQDLYPWADSALQDDWLQELDLLAEALRATTNAEARDLARAFLAHRATRRTTRGLDAQLVDYERQREWVEGLAKYAELEIWRQAATTPGYEPLPAMSSDPDFDSYATFESRWKQEVDQIERMASDRGDGRFYYTGMAQAVLLDQLMPGWKERIVQEEVFLETLLQEAAP